MIRKRVLTSISGDALDVYRAFSTKEGAKYIAKPISIQAVAELIQRQKPRAILEVGGGIGTLSWVCLKNSEAYLDIFEDNEFCIVELKKNLKAFEGRYTIHSDYENYSLPHSSYDLVVFDGGTYTLIDRLRRTLDNIRTVFFEGNGINDRAVFRKALKENYVFAVREYVDGAGRFKGGHEMIVRKSTSWLLRNVLYTYWDITYYIREVVWNTLRRRVERLRNLFAL